MQLKNRLSNAIKETMGRRPTYLNKEDWELYKAWAIGFVYYFENFGVKND